MLRTKDDLKLTGEEQARLTKAFKEPEFKKLMADYMKGPYSTIELNAGHWLLTDFPVEVEQLVLSHLQSY